MRLILFLSSIFTSIIHSRTEYLTYQISESLRRFEFTFHTAWPNVVGRLNHTKKSFKTLVLFWGSMSLITIGMIALSLRHPSGAQYDNQVQGYYLQSYDMDLQTMFGQAPEFVMISDGAGRSQIFGLDANACIQTTSGQQVALEDLIQGMPLIISWNGDAQSPDAILVEIPF